ncbi:hypothetical protein Efla_006492 [Eimeria flavescens]
MFPADCAGDSDDSSAAEGGVDFRAVLYGGGGAPLLGSKQPPVEGGPPWGPPSGALSASAGFSGDESDPSNQMRWASTSYGDWLTASPSRSQQQALLAGGRVHRVGDVQTVRGPLAYRGPPGISQLGASATSAAAAADSTESPAGGLFVGGRGGRSSRLFAAANDQLKPTQLGRPSSFSASPEDVEAANADVYFLAPGSDKESTGSPYSSLGSRIRPSSSAVADGRGVGGPRSAGRRERGAVPLDPPPFERLSPLDVSKGPLRKRRPTDVFCLLLFGASWLLLAWLVGSSLFQASPLKLTAGIDWMGRTCGIDKGVENLPYLYWPSKKPPAIPVDHELDSCSLLPVCTKQCPDGFVEERPSGICDFESESRSLCSWYSSRPTRLMLRRFCVFFDANGISKDHGVLHSWFHWVGDLALVWPLAFMVPLASFALAYSFFLVLRKAAGLAVYLLLSAIELLLISCSFHFFSVARNAAALSIEIRQIGIFSFLPPWAAVVVGVAFACMAVGFLFLILFFWKELSLSITVLKSAAFVLHEAPPKFLLLLPAFSAAAFAAHAGFGLLGVLQLFASSSVSPVLPLRSCGTADPWQRLSLSFSGRLSIAFVVFMAFWSSAFIGGVCQLIISYFTACSYFSPRDADRREVLNAKAAEAAKVILKFHLGSAALGGLLLSLLELASLCLSWIRRMQYRRNETLFRLVLRNTANLLAALHATLSFFTQTAFVYVALIGQPLFKAAWTAAAAQRRNPVAVAFVWQFGRLLQLAGQLAVASLVTWGTYFFLQKIPQIVGPDGQLSSLTAPLLFSFLAAYNVASSCMKCFGFATLTLLQASCLTCYLADVEMARQEGRNTPEFAPRSLRIARKHLLRSGDVYGM